MTSKSVVRNLGIVWGLVLTIVGVCAPNAGAQDALWRSYFNSAQKEYQQGNPGAAEGLLLTALNAATKTDESLSTYFYLAHTCVRLEKFDDAEKDYKVVLDGLGTKTWGVLRPPDGTPDWDQNAALVEQASDTNKFYSVLNKRPPQLLTLRLAKPITIVDALSEYGSLLQINKRYAEAERAYRQALMLADCRPDQSAGSEVRLLQKLDALYKLEGRVAEQDAVSEQLNIARNKIMPDFDQMVSNTIKGLDKFGHNPHSQAVRLNNLALFCATHGDYAKAEELFSRAISCLNETPTKHKKERSLILGNYADLLLAMGRVTDSRNLNREISEVDPDGSAKGTEPIRKSGGY